MADRTRSLVETLFVIEHDVRQMRPQPFVVVIRQQREQPVGPQVKLGHWPAFLIEAANAQSVRKSGQGALLSSGRARRAVWSVASSFAPSDSSALARAAYS